MKIVIYRDKTTKKITNHHEFRDSITQAQIDAFNGTETNPAFVEIVDLEEGSIAYYFYTLKTREMRDYIEDLRNLEEAISDISYAIDSRLSEVERLAKGE
jgi:hypothetical protein